VIDRKTSTGNAVVQYDAACHDRAKETADADQTASHAVRSERQSPTASSSPHRPAHLRISSHRRRKVNNRCSHVLRIHRTAARRRWLCVGCVRRQRGATHSRALSQPDFGTRHRMQRACAQHCSPRVCEQWRAIDRRCILETALLCSASCSRDQHSTVRAPSAERALALRAWYHHTILALRIEWSLTESLLLCAALCCFETPAERGTPLVPLPPRRADQRASH
jgi:hypothetical protein